MDPIDVLADVLEAAFDDVGLHEEGAEEDDGCLDEEGDGEDAALGGGLEAGAEAGEEEGAQDEANEGDEGFGPGVGAGGGVVVGGAETEEHGVAFGTQCQPGSNAKGRWIMERSSLTGLHGDEGAVGVEDCAVEETGGEPA